MLSQRDPGRRGEGQRRGAQKTRERILQAAFQEIYRSGYQSADIESVLKTAELTKGALYYHFPNKEALGLEVAEEVVGKIVLEKWLQPLELAEDPIAALVKTVRSTRLDPAAVRGGCPLNNLAQEMSGINESFRILLAKLFDRWIESIADALRKGQKRGQVRKDIKPRESATFLVATYEGYISLAKAANDPKLLKSGIAQLVNYVESLRAPGSTASHVG